MIFPSFKIIDGYYLIYYRASASVKKSLRPLITNVPLNIPLAQPHEICFKYDLPESYRKEVEIPIAVGEVRADVKGDSENNFLVNVVMDRGNEIDQPFNIVSDVVVDDRVENPETLKVETKIASSPISMNVAPIDDDLINAKESVTETKTVLSLVKNLITTNPNELVVETKNLSSPIAIPATVVALKSKHAKVVVSPIVSPSDDTLDKQVIVPSPMKMNPMESLAIIIDVVNDEMENNVDLSKNQNVLEVEMIPVIVLAAPEMKNVVTTDVRQEPADDASKIAEDVADEESIVYCDKNDALKLGENTEVKFIPLSKNEPSLEESKLNSPAKCIEILPNLNETDLVNDERLIFHSPIQESPNSEEFVQLIIKESVLTMLIDDFEFPSINVISEPTTSPFESKATQYGLFATTNIPPSAFISEIKGVYLVYL
jgi:hypothetical protein